MSDFGEKAIELFNKSMDSIYRLSRRTAEETIRESAALVNKLQELLSNKILRDTEITDLEKTTLSMIYDSLRRIIRYSSGIAEATLNIKVSRNNVVEIK